MKKIFKIVLIVSIGILILAGYFFVGKSKPAGQIEWGVDFSQQHAQNFGLEWREVYLAFLDDLGVKNIKISTSWDLLEPTEGQYNFTDLDWQISQLSGRDAKALLVMGMKTPRWPECHLPVWAKSLSKEKQQEAILKYLEMMVLRYRQRSEIWAWQVENEPLFPFGDCPWKDKSFFKKEVALVKSLDPSRPIVASDSGEGSFWWNMAGIEGVDIVGSTMYREVWLSLLKKRITYPLPPLFYQRKAMLVNAVFNKKVICVELQAEPWGQKLLYDVPVEEQLALMPLEKLRNNINFAKQSGFDAFYLWGGEWWYWMKEKQGKDSFWQEMKKVVKSGHET